MAGALNELRTKLTGRSAAEQRRLGYFFALAGVALVSLVIALARTWAHIPNISILYLFVVLPLASTAGRRPAIFASVLAILAYNFLFTEPVYTFTIRDPDEWLALLVFLLTALVAGQQTAALRQWAEEARRRERDNTALYTSGDMGGASVVRVAPAPAGGALTRRGRQDGAPGRARPAGGPRG